MSTAGSPTEVAELMHTCVKRLRRLVDSELCQHGLSLSRTKVLSQLAKHGPSHQSALAAALDLAPRTVTELVDVLERDGLVERRADPTDRRARQIHLTPAGEEIYGHALATREQVFIRIFSSLTERQLIDLTATMRQINDHVTEVHGVLVDC